MRVLPAGDEEVVVCGVVALEGGGGHEAFEVEIEAVDVLGAEGARFAGSDPRRGLGSESAPEEVSEVLGHGLVLEVVVGGVTTANREKHFLAVGVACLDAFRDTGAVRTEA